METGNLDTKKGQLNSTKINQTEAHYPIYSSRAETNKFKLRYAQTKQAQIKKPGCYNLVL
jgi:hypothetical protein